MRINLRWVSHIKDPEKKSEFTKTILASTTMASRLLEILEEEERQIDSSMCSIKEFDSPNWSLKQAFYQGEKSRIKKLRELLEFNKD